MEYGKKWELSLQEEKILGEKRTKEYYDILREYWDYKMVRNGILTMLVETFAIVAAGVLLKNMNNAIGSTIPNPAKSAITYTILFSVVIAAGVLSVLAGNKLKVTRKQNPKDWKDEILAQKTLNTEGYSKKTRNSSTSNAYTVNI